MHGNRDTQEKLPSLRELGPDLLDLSFGQRFFSLALPFLWCAGYFVFALRDWWWPAIFALVALSFVTYGSVSHDLVHRNLGLPRWVNDVLLCVIELLALRSGHAYQAAHLHHHARFPHDDDVEAIRASRSLLGAFVEGFVGQVRIWIWAVRNAPTVRGWVIGEGIVIVAMVAVALVVATPVFAVYVALLVMGSWIIPLVTSYLPHDPHGNNALAQTRAFRGVLASLLALEHLYHLEHHLYPAVPHHHWATLANRLDPHFERAGVKVVRFWF